RQGHVRKRRPAVLGGTGCPQEGIPSLGDHLAKRIAPRVDDRRDGGRFSGMPKGLDARERPFYLPERGKVPDPVPGISRIRLLHRAKKAQSKVEV
ncbi:MAG: hypothetical protein WBN01_13075, partial [Polyangiales bacterium]